MPRPSHPPLLGEEYKKLKYLGMAEQKYQYSITNQDLNINQILT
jgi:hypothetical protein